MNSNLHSLQPTSLPPTFCVVRFDHRQLQIWSLYCMVRNQVLHFMDSPHCFKVNHRTQCLRSRHNNNVRHQNFPLIFFPSNFRRKCYKISGNAFKRPLYDVTSKFRHFIAIKHSVMQWKKTNGKENDQNCRKLLHFLLYIRVLIVLLTN